MNHALHAFIGKFIVIYFDYILIYSKNFKNYISHFRYVLEVFRKEKLYANLRKSIFV